jgi:hypothetical protein
VSDTFVPRRVQLLLEALGVDLMNRFLPEFTDKTLKVSLTGL